MIAKIVLEVEIIEVGSEFYEWLSGQPEFDNERTVIANKVMSYYKSDNCIQAIRISGKWHYVKVSAQA